MKKSLPRASSRGFTLVELMTVVVIVGVLAVIGLASFRKRTMGSRSTEAFAMIQSLRAAEERYKSENLMYLNASVSGTWFPDDPSGKTPRMQRTFYPSAHADLANFRVLNPAIVGLTEFGYKVNAGPPSVAMTKPSESIGFTFPTTGEHWYVIQAIADADGDKVVAFFLASSIRADIYHRNDGE